MDEHDDVTRKCFRLVCSDRMTRRRRRNDAAVVLLASGGDIGVLMCLLLNCYDDVVMTRRGGRGTQHAPLFFFPFLHRKACTGAIRSRRKEWRVHKTQLPYCSWIGGRKMNEE